MKANPPDILRPMTSADLELVLAWRNGPDVRKYMYSQAEIGIVEHQNWFEVAQKDTSTHLLILECEGAPCGYSRLSQWRGGPVAEWGFYIAPDAAKGTGTRLAIAVLNHAFDVLKLTKVFAQTLAFNTRTLAYNERMGFRLEGIWRDHFFDGVTHHSIHCFGLLADEWQTVCERNAWK
jgi:UDP-4-amino-4,6-dideoxy-N-acetyl-beta-L-altrosamine N-acetyltransferase